MLGWVSGAAGSGLRRRVALFDRGGTVFWMAVSIYLHLALTWETAVLGPDE
jgi:hypothetical protein